MLLVNATSVGTPEVPGCLVSQDMLHKDLIMADVVYVPRDTQFVELGLSLIHIWSANPKQMQLLP